METYLINYIFPSMNPNQFLFPIVKKIKDNIECVGVITADADGQHLFEDIKTKNY